MKRNPWWARDFYLKFPILTALRSELSWTHYRMLPERARLEQVRAPGK
jgi:hypothetical protein